MKHKEQKATHPIFKHHHGPHHPVIESPMPRQKVAWNIWQDTIFFKAVVKDQSQIQGGWNDALHLA